MVERKKVKKKELYDGNVAMLREGLFVLDGVTVSAVISSAFAFGL